MVRWSRREVLQMGTAAAVLPYGLLDDAGLRPGRPWGFPATVPLARRRFENWAGVIRANGLWTARPRDAAEVLDVVRWAHGAGWTVRVRGAMHGWSPLVVAPGAGRTTPTVLLDLRELSSLALVSADPAAVRAGAGATMLDLLSFLGDRGLGLTSVPATGAPTVAGVLAIAGHGAALPASGETLAPGHTYSSLSNAVLELTAVVWDRDKGDYALRTFTRDEPEMRALLVHLGRAVITDVVLRAGRDTPMRCQSLIDVPAAELFAPPGSPGRTFDTYLDQSGRVEAIWFPFTPNPWLKVWTPSPDQPASSRAVTQPYNYPFSDSVPKPVAKLADRIVRGADASTPTFGAMEYEVVRHGLQATDSADIWGASKDVQLYIRASTLRVDELGYGVLTRRADVQRVLSVVAETYLRLVEEERAQGRYPINGPVELRCSGIERPRDTGVPGAEVPSLAASAPRADRPAWDTVVWVNLLTFPDTRGSLAFYRRFERWILRTFDGAWATARPEWSKSWAFTKDRRWADRDLLDEVFPDLFSAGRPRPEGWDATHAILGSLDPHGVFSNPFLDRWGETEGQAGSRA